MIFSILLCLPSSAAQNFHIYVLQAVQGFSVYLNIFNRGIVIHKPSSNLLNFHDTCTIHQLDEWNGLVDLCSTF